MNEIKTQRWKTCSEGRKENEEYLTKIFVKISEINIRNTEY